MTACNWRAKRRKIAAMNGTRFALDGMVWRDRRHANCYTDARRHPMEWSDDVRWWGLLRRMDATDWWALTFICCIVGCLAILWWVTP